MRRLELRGTTPVPVFLELKQVFHLMQHIEAVVEPGAEVSEYLIRSLHAMTVDRLERERDRNPGACRSGAVAIKAGVVKAGDLAGAMPSLSATQRTYQVKKLIDRGMLQPVQAGARQYTARPAA